MYNWSTDVEVLKKQSDKYAVWRLVQLINYGLDGEKLDRGELENFWPQIADQIDPYKKRLLEFLLWGKVYSLPNNLNFWNVSEKSRK